MCLFRLAEMGSIISGSSVPPCSIQIYRPRKQTQNGQINNGQNLNYNARKQTSSNAWWQKPQNSFRNIFRTTGRHSAAYDTFGVDSCGRDAIMYVGRPILRIGLKESLGEAKYISAFVANLPRNGSKRAAYKYKYFLRLCRSWSLTLLFLFPFDFGICWPRSLAHLMPPIALLYPGSHCPCSALPSGLARQ